MMIFIPIIIDFRVMTSNTKVGRSGDMEKLQKLVQYFDKTHFVISTEIQ